MSPTPEDTPVHKAASKLSEVLAAKIPKPPQASVIDAAFTQRAGLRQVLTTNLATAAGPAAEVAAKAQKAFSNFNPSQYSTKERASRNHVASDTDPSEMVNAVVKRYVDSGSAAARAGAMTIRAEGELARMKVDDAIPLDSLLNYLSAQPARSYSFAASSALATCCAQSQAQAWVDSVGAAPGADVDNGGKPEPAANKDVGALVANTVNLQMTTATSPESELVYKIIPNSSGTRQTDLLGTFELRPDPTNVTSYHDFNTLQIAFEHVWTQLFDAQLKSVGMQLYQEYVPLKALSGSAAPDPTINTLDDLANLLTEIRSLSQFVQSTTPSSLPVGTAGTPTSANSTVDDVGRIGAFVTAGSSALFELALNAFANAGKKPRIAWNDLNTGNPLPGHGDHIVATLEYSVAPPGSIQFAIKTDTNSAFKQVAFQYWDQNSGQFSNFLSVSNGGKIIVKDADGQDYFKETSPPIPLSLIQTGGFEFDSQDGPTSTPGRYTLGDLTDQLVDGSRVTFYWSGAQ